MVFAILKNQESIFLFTSVIYTSLVHGRWNLKARCIRLEPHPDLALLGSALPKFAVLDKDQSTAKEWFIVLKVSIFSYERKE
jgi:hypothetical protein